MGFRGVKPPYTHLAYRYSTMYPVMWDRNPLHNGYKRPPELTNANK